MPLLKVSESSLKVMGCPKQLSHKNTVRIQKPVDKVQTTELELDRNIEQLNANMKRRKGLMDKLEKKTVPPAMKMIDPVTLIREDRDR